MSELLSSDICSAVFNVLSENDNIATACQATIHSLLYQKRMLIVLCCKNEMLVFGKIVCSFQGCRALFSHEDYAHILRATNAVLYHFE